jgi:hypothetical protein
MNKFGVHFAVLECQHAETPLPIADFTLLLQVDPCGANHLVS